MFLGNDLVHWSGTAAREKESLSRRTRRFVARVLHEGEHALLERLGTIRSRMVTTPLPRGRALWALWAAKEATFKAAVKAWPGLVFSPRSIRIEFFPALSGHGGREGRDPWPVTRCDDSGYQAAALRPLARGLAHVRDHVYEILWEYHDDVVHAVAMGPFPRGGGGGHDQRHGDHWNAIVRTIAQIPSHRASEAVRSIALHLLSDPHHAVAPGVGIVRNLLTNGRLGPPTIHDGAPREDLDLTLTHDGPWGAAAIFRRTAPT
ncbi:MAG: 4'-phosphopantetheinyl transferase superfamily protein [Alkalispirochaeta sp.]